MSTVAYIMRCNHKCQTSIRTRIQHQPSELKWLHYSLEGWVVLMITIFQSLGSRRYPMSEIKVARSGLEPGPFTPQAKSFTTAAPYALDQSFLQEKACISIYNFNIFESWKYKVYVCTFNDKWHYRHWPLSR